MALRIEDRINTTVFRQCEAVAKELLNTLLTHASIEVACDHDWRRPGHLANDLQHVLRTSVANIRVASVAIATVNTPVSVEMPKGATAGGVPQLHPVHKTRAPLPPRLQIPRTLRLHAKNTWLRHHPLVIIERRDGTIHVASPRCNCACAVALLQADRVCLHSLDVVNDAIALAGVLLKRVPPEEVV